MFCPHCGHQLAEDAVFCENCGKKVEPEDQPSSVPEGRESPQPVVQDSGGAAAVKISAFLQKNRKFVLIGAAVVIVVIALVLIIAMMPTKINLNDYITVNFSGYDTRGTATFSIDQEAFSQDFSGKISYQGADQTQLFLDDEALCKRLLNECVGGSLSKTENLSNGEEIIFTWECDDTTANADFGVSLSYEDLPFTVEGLEQAQTVDPFADLEIVYRGIAPDGSIDSITNHSSEPYADELRFSAEPSSGLDNGDTITVSIALDAAGLEDYFLSNYGVLFSETEKTFTVDGLGAYLSALSQIGEDDLTSLTTQGEDVLTSYVAKNWDEIFSLGSMDYLGSYLLTAKDSSRTYRNNILYLLYEVQVNVNAAEAGIQESFSYYYAVRFEDLIVTPDGTLTVDLSDYSVDSDRFQREYDGRRYSFIGYETLEDAFRECVSVNVDQYNYESSLQDAEPAPEEGSAN